MDIAAPVPSRHPGPLHPYACCDTCPCRPPASVRCLRPSGKRLFHLLGAQFFVEGLRPWSACPLDRSSLYRHRDNQKSGLQIHCMLAALSRQVRPPVLHSGNPRIRIMRASFQGLRFGRPLPVRLRSMFSGGRQGNLPCRGRQSNPGGGFLVVSVHQVNSSVPCSLSRRTMLRSAAFASERSGITDADRLMPPQQAARPESASDYPVKD